MDHSIKHIIHYSYVISEFSKTQLLAWLSLIKCNDFNLIVEVVHNILYNYELTLTDSHKKQLKPYYDAFLSIVNNSIKKDSKYIIIQKNPRAIKTAFQVVYDIYGSRI